MWIGSVSLNWNMYLSPVGRTDASTGVSQPVAPIDQQAQLRFAGQELSKLRRALTDIEDSWRPVSLDPEYRSATVRSTGDLGLGVATAAYLDSTEEINATPTSFSPFGPDWDQASTAEATIDGVYDGSAGSGTLTFTVTKGGVHGEDAIKITIDNPDGSTLQEITVAKNHPLDREYALDNGLIFTLGAGEVVKNDTFEVEISDTVGSVADVDQSFDGIRNDNPNLEYGLAVTAGSFTVNGTIIDVATDDSVNSVLDRINESDAGVTAVYNAGTERITLAYDTVGAEGSVVLADDTSGFLEATKLTGAVMVAGQDQDTDRLLSDVDRFSDVDSGNITINGVDIAIDVDADSLQDVIDRINDADAGVTANIDPTGRFVSFTSDDADTEMILDDNDLGFFPALEITPASYDPNVTFDRRGMTRHRANLITKAMEEASQAINALFGPLAGGESPGTFLAGLRTQLSQAIGDAFGDGGLDRADRFGLDFQFGAANSPVFSFSGKQHSELITGILRNRGEVEQLFFGRGTSSGGGFVDSLLENLDLFETSLENALGSTGRLIDTYA